VHIDMLLDCIIWRCKCY